LKYLGKTLLNYNRDRKLKLVLSGGGYQWEREGHKERVKEGKCRGYILHPYIKIEE
jgi:hypothetical protein